MRLPEVKRGFESRKEIYDLSNFTPVSLSDGLVSQLRQLSANQNSQLSQLSARLQSLEAMMEQLEQRDVTHQLDQVLHQLKDGIEGNT
jgi:predicted transcriptional regulator